MNLSDLLSLFDIVITVLIGFVITHMVSVHDTRTRSIKDYYIQELTGIKSEINEFYSHLFKGEYNAKEIIGWYSAIRNRVYCFDQAVRKTFKLYNPTLAKSLFINYKHITETDEFNADFTKDKVIFKGVTKKRIGYEERQLYAIVEQIMYDINNVGSRDYLQRKRLELQAHYRYYRSEQKSTRVGTWFRIAVDWLDAHKTKLIVILAVLFAFYYGTKKVSQYVGKNQYGNYNVEQIQQLDSLKAIMSEMLEAQKIPFETETPLTKFTPLAPTTVIDTIIERIE